jgi:hypothetical protein
VFHHLARLKFRRRSLDGVRVALSDWLVIRRSG